MAVSERFLGRFRLLSESRQVQVKQQTEAERFMACRWFMAWCDQEQIYVQQA